MLAFVFTMSAQTLRSGKDNRNIAPTVGTGGPVGGPTGLFTIYDGQTLRKGEFTFSIAYSNFDRDPGDVDITEVPTSFQIGLGDHLELFFNTDAYRALKVNSPFNLSSFYLPNTQLNIPSLNGALATPGAIVLAPQGPGSSGLTGGAVFRPAGAPFVPFPFVGGNFGNNGFTTAAGIGNVSIGSAFGFPSGTAVTYGAPVGGHGHSAAAFPGLGSIYGSILPGVVLSTQSIAIPNSGGVTTTQPVVYTTAPSYLPDAPFIGRTYGESSFSTFVIGGKFRLNSVKSAFGLAVIPFYRFYADSANSASGFNQLQRGASPGGGGGGGNFFTKRLHGDVGLNVAADYRARKWLNVSGNVGYIYNSSVKGSFPSGEFTILDRPDEFQYGVGLDFPVNRYFQPILEYRQTRYVGGHTPNAFENDPMDGIAGTRIFPRRWFGFGLAYRYNFNQQDRNSIRDVTFSQTVNVLGPPSSTNTGANVIASSTTSSGPLLNAFRTSSDPHGFIFQFFAGHRNARGKPDIVNQPANVTALDLDKTTITLPCPAGTSSASCPTDVQTVGVRTTAVDPEGDVLTYSYTVSGGRITGQGANVTWDLTGVRPGTYTITSAVDDGCGFCGATKTNSVTVVDCPNCVAPPVACVCPTISVTEPTSVTSPGADMTFTANVSGGNTDASYTYNWTVSNGTITSGQGTPSITVATTSAMAGQNVVATVTIGGITCTTCTTNTAMGTGSVGQPLTSTETVVGKVPADQLKANLDTFFTQLQNDPTAHGVIITSGTNREVAKREADIRKAAAFRNFDLSRITFVRGSTTPGVSTRLVFVPAGAPEPTP
ncbi:MAG: hypothetical protein ACR2N3_17115 [Pyrinomonadaceae bacterium]